MTRLPVTRGNCLGGPRPCAVSACKWRLPKDALASCALDVADAGPHTLEVVGAILGVTKERARQIEEEALAKLARRAPWLAAELVDLRPGG